MTAEVFMARIEERIRLTGADFDAALESLVVTVPRDELGRLGEEFLELAYGGDTAARDAAKRRAFEESQEKRLW
jgi:hypothetical protein